MRHAWSTSLLFGVLALSGSFACSSDEEPPGPAASSSSSGASDAGTVVDIEDIDLAVYPLRQYTGFDGTHDFQVPFSVFRAKEDLTVEASDPTAVDIVPATYDAAKEDGRYFLIKPKKAGEITLTAKSRGKSVSSTLTIIGYAAGRYATGETRYENADGEQKACAECHQKSGGADHSPASISAAADDAVKAVIRTGIDLSNSPIRQVDHRWTVSGPTLDGLVTYLRALPPRGYTPAAQSMRRQSGGLRHVRLRDLVPAHGDFVQTTRNVLAAHPEWLGSVTPGSLVLRRERGDRLGKRQLRFAQVERGVPVLGAELAAHYDQHGALRSLDSTLVQGLADVDLTPRIDPAQAEQVVLAAYTQRFGGDPTRARLGFQAWGEADTTPVLGIHTRAGARTLVYSIGLASELGGRPLRLRARVDAQTGKLVELYDDAKSITAYSNGVFGAERNLEVEQNTRYELIDGTRGGGIYTYTAEENLDLPGSIVSSTTKDGNWDQSVPNGKGSAVDAHFFAAVVYDFFKDRFQRRGIDGKDAPIRSTVHYGLRYDNAFWEGRQMAYGDGDLFGPFAGALDVVAHELTHGITQSESDLEYAFQSGAINESISDIFGAMVEHSITEKETDNWLIGEKIQRTEGTPLRSMIDPSKAEVPQPLHMEEYLDLTLEQDNGGVHLNSGIVNNAAYLMTMGGTHRLSKVEVRTGIGWAKAAELWYRVNTEYLLRQSEFSDCAQATLDAADELEFTTEERDTVECAWKAVGVLKGECGGATVDPSTEEPEEEAANEDAGETSSSSGVLRAGRGSGAKDADFNRTASACDASFGATSAPWAFGLLALALARRVAARRPS